MYSIALHDVFFFIYLFIVFIYIIYILSTLSKLLYRPKLVDERCRIQSPVTLVNLAFGDFGGYLRNSCKYGLRFYWKVSVVIIPPTGLGPTCGQLVLILQSNLNINYLVFLTISHLNGIPFRYEMWNSSETKRKITKLNL